MGLDGDPDADAIAELAGRLAAAIAATDATAAGVATVAGGDVHDDGAPLGVHTSPDVPGVRSVSVTRRWDSDVPNSAEIELFGGLSLADVAARLGAPTHLPSNPSGRQTVALEGGEAPATLLAALDDDGLVSAITVLRDG